MKGSSYRIDGDRQCLQNEIMCHSVYETKLRGIRKHEKESQKTDETGLWDLGREINTAVPGLESVWKHLNPPGFAGATLH